MEIIMYKIMTPGPTQVPETVRRARSFACTNPDLDEEFYDFYCIYIPIIDNGKVINFILKSDLLYVTLYSENSLRK